MTPNIPPHIAEAISALTQLTAHVTGAQSCSLVDLEGLPEDRADLVSPSLVRFPFAAHTSSGKVRAELVCSFASGQQAEAARAVAARLADSIRAMWELGFTLSRYSDIARRAADLEAQVLASKVNARARGLLEERAGTDAAEAMTRHVDLVLQSSTGLRTLTDLLRGFETELRDRELTAQAKTLLQEQQGISEGEAYLHLRRASRSSRRPLAEVARGIIESHSKRDKIA